MNFLSIFVLIPLLMLAGLWAAQGIKAIRGVMVTGASALLIASVVLTFMYLGERSAGNTAEMLFRADTLWYAPLHISYSVGVDGISVAMLLLSAIIVFTGTFASWRLQPLTKEYFLWFTLLSMGVFGFFISIDLFTMFMFYEIALIPMYLLIGVWGSGRKEYAAMKLTLMLMGGSAAYRPGRGVFAPRRFGCPAALRDPPSRRLLPQAHARERVPTGTTPCRSTAGGFDFSWPSR